MNSLVGLVLTIAGLATGCSLFIPEETLYLRVAQNVATQEQVREQLGAPRDETSMPDGESQWIYEVREQEPGSQSTWSAAGSWCDEYVLTFDQQGVLRAWTHKSYFHGGEMMPIRCDAGTQRAAL